MSDFKQQVTVNLPNKDANATADNKVVSRVMDITKQSGAEGTSIILQTPPQIPLDTVLLRVHFDKKDHFSEAFFSVAKTNSENDITNSQEFSLNGFKQQRWRGSVENQEGLDKVAAPLQTQDLTLIGRSTLDKQSEITASEFLNILLEPQIQQAIGEHINPGQKHSFEALVEKIRALQSCDPPVAQATGATGVKVSGFTLSRTVVEQHPHNQGAPTSGQRHPSTVQHPTLGGAFR